MYKIIFFLIAVSTAWLGTAQCNCTPANTLSSNINSGGYTFASGQTTCISGNVTIQWSATFQDNTTVCLLPGATLKINNQIIGSANSNVTINIGENATFKIPNSIPSSFNITVASGGQITGLNSTTQDLAVNGDAFNLTIEEGGKFNFSILNLDACDSAIINNAGTFNCNGNDLKVGASNLQLTNSGTMTIGGNFNLGTGVNENVVSNSGTITISGEINGQNSKLSLSNNGTIGVTGNLTYGSEGPNLFENYGTFSCNGLYSTDPTLHLKNAGDMTTSANYDDTVGSFFSNCGTLHMSNNWANLQGTIINTGDMTITVSSVAFSATGRIDNYSIMSLKGVTMGTAGAIFYNEGEVTFTSNEVYDVKFAGPGSSYQPEHSTSTNYGRFKWPGVSNGTGFVKGNLNLVNTSGTSSQTGMFGNNSVSVDSTVTYGDCSGCVVVTEYDQCANADGTWPVVVTNPGCIPINRHIRTNL